MSILNKANNASVDRGYDYYVGKEVVSFKQLNDYEYEGYVKGSQKQPYHVKINVKHPEESTCDCPYARGGNICKHMVALYFSAYPEEGEDYNDWFESSDKNIFKVFEDDFYDDDEEDEEFLEYLAPYLQPIDFNRDLLGESNFVFLDGLQTRILEELGFYKNHHFHVYKHLFSSNDIDKIKELYEQETLKPILDNLVFTPQLASYHDFRKSIPIYKNGNGENVIYEFCEELKKTFNSLKHYSIDNLLPKSNLLITMYLLKDESLDELAQSLYDHAKYNEYISFVIDHSDNTMDLYKSFMCLVEKGELKNKQYIPNVLCKFVQATGFCDESICYNCYLYSFLGYGDVAYLKGLSYLSSKDKIVQQVESKTTKALLLIKLYAYFKMSEELWNLVNNDEYRYLLVEYNDLFKEKHSLELYKYFKERFYSSLIMNRIESYRKASLFMKLISELRNGKELVNEVLKELEESKYQRCRSLFLEIEKCTSISK